MSDTGPGAGPRSGLRGLVEIQPTTGWPRRLAGLVWFPVIVVATLAGSGPHPGPVAAVVGVLLAGIGWAGLAFQVVRPAWLVVLLLAAGGIVLMYGAGTWTSGASFSLVGAFVAGLRLPLARALGLGTVVAAGMIAVLAPYDSPTDPVVIVVCAGAAVLLGTVRRDARRRDSERERSLVADARARAEHARADAIAERARIARDVHDVLAHSLSALAVQLQGARLMALRDGAAADTVAQIERSQQLATEGLTEARRAVRALREGPEVPVDVADGLRALVADHPGATAEIDDCALDARAGEAVLRTAQEALTNVRKHAPGASVHVRLRRAGDGTELEVTDVTGDPPPPADGSGYGLVGMTERAELVGATVDAGPTADGWRVVLRMPEATRDEEIRT